MKTVCLILLTLLLCTFSAEGAITQQFTRDTSEVIKLTSATWADINGDGYPDLVGSTDDDTDINGNGVRGRIAAYDVKNNVTLWEYTPSPATIIASTPTVADVRGNGTVEIIFGVGDGIGGSTMPGRVYVLDHNGNFLWSFDTIDYDNNGYRDGVVTTAAIGDLDRDGLLDFVIASFDQRVYAFKYNTSTQTFQKMWEFLCGDTIHSSPALANIDNDPYLEIMIGIPIHIEVDQFNTDFPYSLDYDGGMLLVLNHDGSIHPDFGLAIPGKPKTYATQEIRSSPAVADIDNDGRFEIVHATSPFRGGFGPPQRCGPSAITPIPLPVVYAWNHNGTAAWPSWPSLGAAPANACDSSIINDSETSPAIGDINLDGKLDVVVSQRSTNGTAKVFVIRGDTGTFVSPFPQLLTNHLGQTPGAGVRSNPIIALFDNDSYPDMFFGLLNDLMYFDRNGVSTSKYMTATGQIVYSAAAAWDCDGDGRVEIAQGSGNSNNTTGRYSVWDSGVTNANYTTPPGSWPMYRQNKHHTGLYDTVPPAAISNLAVQRINSTTVTLTWTATGHNGTVGCAFSYDIRYSVDNFDWNSATRVANPPLPAVSGTVQSMTISGLTEGPSYHLAIVVSDEVPNSSTVSNVAVLASEVPTLTASGIIILVMLFGLCIGGRYSRVVRVKR